MHCVSTGAIEYLRALYAAPLELNRDVDSRSITIPLLTELFRGFKKTKVLRFFNCP
jgi:hypothetical protein